MKSLVEILLALLLLLAAASWSFPTYAAILNAPESGSSEKTLVPAETALVLRVQTDDLRSVIKGVGHQLGQAHITGRYEGPIFGEHPLGPLGVHGVSYSFDLRMLDVTPANGYIALSISIENLKVMIDRVTFNQAETRWCANVPLSSYAGAIHVSADATVIVQDRYVDLGVSGQHIGLSASNFHVGAPEFCHAFSGFNWLIRRMTPWFANLIRDRVRESITGAIIDAARRTVRSLNDVLQVSITLPFAAKPAPAFYATVTIWPAHFEVQSGVVSFSMGADVHVDPDALQIPEGTTTDDDYGVRKSESITSVPTYAGIKREFLSAVLNEANKKGLFKFRVDASEAPEAADLLTTDVLANIIPDAKQRFLPGTELTLVAQGAETTHVTIEPQGPGGLPILTVQLKNLALGIEVAGSPYYKLLVNLDVLLHAGYDRSGRELALGLQGVQVLTREHEFDAQISPRPSDQQFDNEQFAQLIKNISSTLEARSRRLIAIGLPSFDIAWMRLDFLGSQLREDAVTLDGQIVEALPR